MDQTMLNRILTDSRTVMAELLEVAGLKPGKLLVVGCSTSEIVGKRIGTASVKEIAQAVIQGICPVIEEKGLFLAAQCCEHLNRALIMESAVAELRGYEPVCVVPRIKAGGAFAAEAYQGFNEPVAVESIVADAGVDIGDTFIGMHLHPVAVPVRTRIIQIGYAHVTVARCRPKFIGGKRSEYEN
ncbi:TIGR01440 family protein [Desulfospira joergensenii]|uniref:TIGR01440 family protein n=1 Tax=Desulfospira joergensenii TaxID=53329 RepID=UPI000526AF89|nr:TIGR01440 family protein [Desulfospira joergensenii]